MRTCAKTLESELAPKERTALVKAISANRFQNSHLEIGTAAGGTLWEMMSCFSDTERPKFVVVDPMNYFPHQYSSVRANLVKHGINPDIVDFRIAKSEFAFRNAEAAGEKFDFIFVDGSHKIAYVTKDLLWSRLLNTNGLLCIHDFSPQFPGVWKSVRRFLKRNSNYQVEEWEESLIIVRKISPSLKKEISSWDLFLAQALMPIYQLGSSVKKWISVLHPQP